MSEPISDPQFLKRLYENNQQLIYRLILYTLRTHINTVSDADDLTQEVFIVAAKQIEALKNHPNPTGWLVSTAYNLCKNHIRTVIHRNEILCDSPELHAGSDDVFAAYDIQLSMQQILKPEDYEILIEYCIQKRPSDEICDEYSLTPTTLRVRIHRLRRNLLHHLILLVTIGAIRHI
ncbi:MAG: sigma-70 family RNA polymerase sigma factor [Clostridia bacterium]|nr:sigma-70 family RNA polymerase sigma factor [Clostridia bacterium]